MLMSVICKCYFMFLKPVNAKRSADIPLTTIAFLQITVTSQSKKKAQGPEIVHPTGQMGIVKVPYSVH